MLKFAFALLCAILGFAPVSAQSTVRGDIHDLAWSPDGATLAVLADRGIWLYDALDWDAPPRTVSLDEAVVRNLAFSPDGHLLAAGAEPGVHIWEVDTLTHVQLLEGVGGHVIFASDGKFLYVVRNGVDKFAVETGQHVSHFGGDYWSMWALTISPDGRWLVEGNGEEGGHVWDLATETLTTDIFANFTDLDFSPDSSLVAVGEYNGSITLWDSATFKIKLEIKTGIEDTRLTDVAFHPNSLYIVATYQDGRLILANTKTGEILVTLQAHNPPENSFIDQDGLAFDPAGLLLATGSDDGTVGIWSFDKGLVSLVATLGGYTPQDADWTPRLSG